MGKRLSEDIRRNMDAKSTDELLEIYQANNRDEWSEEALEIIRILLVERGETVSSLEDSRKNHKSRSIILSPGPTEIPILKLPDVYEAALGEAIKNNPQRNPIPYVENNVKVSCPKCGVDYNANGFQIGFLSSLVSNAKEGIPMSFSSGDKGIYPRCMKGICPNQSCSCRNAIIRWLG
jgi:hypothetical protein